MGPPARSLSIMSEHSRLSFRPSDPGFARIEEPEIRMWTAPGSQEEVQQPRIGSLAIICPV